jgi:hypothetical protein
MTKYAIVGHEKERSKVTNLLETMRKGRLQSLVLQNTRKVIEIDVGFFGTLSVHLWSSFGMVKYVIVWKKPLNQGVWWYMEMHIVGTVCHGYLREFTAQKKIDNLIFYN